VYRYNGHQCLDEIEFDAGGDQTFTKGDIVRRPEQNWKVERVHVEMLKGALSPNPSLWVYLVDIPESKGSSTASIGTPIK
jgi:hypothetical protein